MQAGGFDNYLINPLFPSNQIMDPDSTSLAVTIVTFPRCMRLTFVEHTMGNQIISFIHLLMKFPNCTF